MRTVLLVLLAVPCAAHTITQPFPAAPASLSVFAGEGDLTFCQVGVVKAAPGFTLTCRKAGATYFTATVIKSSGVISNGDIVWMFNWDLLNPRLVHVQASANVRDPGVFAAWLNFGTVTGEFTIGESVRDAAGIRSATVSHWTHTTGTVLVDGAVNPQYGAQISLTNATSPFLAGEQLIGAVSGATGVIGNISPITSQRLKSALDVEWPAAAPSSSFLGRMWRATLGRVF
jgi:hypothetical protein